MRERGRRETRSEERERREKKSDRRANLVESWRAGAEGGQGLYKDIPLTGSLHE